MKVDPLTIKVLMEYQRLNNRPEKLVVQTTNAELMTTLGFRQEDTFWVLLSDQANLAAAKGLLLTSMILTEHKISRARMETYDRLYPSPGRPGTPD